MKLRTRQGSLRLRLTRGEVTTLAERGSVEERIDIGPDAALVVALVTSDGAEGVGARMEGTRITVSVPTRAARSWAASEEVGMTGQQPVPGREPLTVLVEKDFACLEPRGREDEDAFPHPGTASGKC